MNTTMEVDPQGRQSDLSDGPGKQRESYVVENGILRHRNEADAPQLAARKVRFGKDQKGPVKVKVMVLPDKAQIKRGRNHLIIIQKLKLLKITFKEVLMTSHIAAEVEFANGQDANLCLQRVEEAKETGIIARIENRELITRGVITDWPDNIPGLWEALEDKSKVCRMEKMYRRRWDEREKNFREDDTGNIIITFYGNKVVEKMWLWEHEVAIKVRPYIPALRQCFKCFRFGHIKAVCKSEEKCIICGEKAHGRCVSTLKCRNCRGPHKSTFKNCPEVMRNKNINVIMAYHNLSFKNAERILEGREDKRPINAYDRVPANEEPRKGKEYSQVLQEGDREDIEDPARYGERENSPREKARNRSFGHYQQFNTREEEISRNRYGIANGYRRGHSTERKEGQGWRGQEEVRGRKVLSQNKYELPSPESSDEENLRNLVVKLVYLMERDEELRRMLYAILEEPKTIQLESQRYNRKREEEQSLEIKRKKEREGEEERDRQIKMIEQNKRNYWQSRRVGETESVSHASP
ncbi:PREDICTED: uncharacterized protein LOC105456695 [Wasmannia auropunctata]|uniref:uncharacterized protein LOC105456695 n=1 Tax=Wasmannia auropunctata TaxID=64793 RepID=UPI0005EE40FD|nr:PREDICTED: uncharacterized protein LOC105456695 [Wasmannia auropunctata]